MKNILSVLVIGSIISMFFGSFFFQHKLPIPSDSLVGLYHPFRDAFAAQYPRGLPFKNFLITDPVRQQYVWRFLAYQLETKGILPLWNPYNGLGMPLLGNQQSAVLYPFNLLFFILPFATAWSFQVFLSPVLGALFLFLYLRQVKVSFFGSVFAGISFSFSGFVIAWLEWNTIVQSFLWLPFLLWSIEKLFISTVLKKRLLYIVIVSLGLVLSLLAGHLQTFFYVSVVSTLYFLLKLWQERSGRKQFVMLFVTFFLLTLFISLVQLIPTLQLISLSARTVDLDWHATGWFIPYQHLLQFIIPDFFGNPTTMNYWGVWNYGELVGYIGIIPLIFACIGGFFVRRKVVYFFLGILLLSLLFATANPIATLPFLFHIPFLSTSQPTRLLSLIDFALIILAAFGVDYARNMSKKQLLFIISIFGFVFVGVWVFLLFGTKMIPAFPVENLLTAKRNSMLPTGLFLIASFILVTGSFLRYRKTFLIMFSFILLLSVYDGIRFGEKFTPFTQQQLLYSSTKTISFLQQHLNGYRYMTTDDRLLPPNVNAYYQLQSLDVYDPLYLQRYGEFIAALGRGKPDVTPPFGFNRIITPHTINNPFMNLLGVKFILSLDDLNDLSLKKVFEEGQTKVYENSQVLPRAFFIKEIIPAFSKQQAIEKLFAEKDSLNTKAVVEGVQQRITLMQGKAWITLYTPSKVSIQTDSSGDGFLVVTDAYYPTWHVFIDGRETRVYMTDYVLRGVFVPKGKHTIAFNVVLF